MDRMNILVLFGGMAEEHDVSVKSARELAKAIDAEKYRPLYAYISKEGAWRLVDSPETSLKGGARAMLSADRSAPGLIIFEGEGVRREPVQAVFPMLHGRYGEDGCIQGLLDLAGMPYVGCGVAASAMSMDKALTYMAAARAGVRVPRHWTLGAGESVAGGEWAYPVFVKPARSGSSFGVSKVYMASGLNDAIDDARRYDDKVLIEEAVAGAEVGCAVLGRANDIITGEIDEIELSGGFFRIHQEKTPERGSENAIINVPARIPDAAKRRATDAAKAVYRALECRGLARVDMFLTPEQEIVLNEVNTMPGFTSYSRYPQMMRAAGVTMGALIDALITQAVRCKI